MIHFGDITKISGFNVPIVDVVVGGSPCQDLSVAGKRKGLEGARSGLFMEQIRIIKEMRENDRQTNGHEGADIRPRFMLWENVVGAFSSNRGEDFRRVLEETAKVVERDACVPGFEGGGYGHTQDVYWVPGGVLLGEYTMRSFGECPNVEKESHLLQILERGAHPKYNLSAKACQGILRRAEKRKKELPLILKEALEMQAGGIAVSDVMYTLNTVEQHAVCVSESSYGTFTENDKGGTLKSVGGCLGGGQRDARDREFEAVTLDDTVGALCAVDYKGVGNQYVEGRGKEI